MKQKISAEKKPRLAADDISPELAYPKPEKLAAKEKGLRTVIKMDNGKELSIFNLNKSGQKLLGTTLPEVYEHLGTDLVENSVAILC